MEVRFTPEMEKRIQEISEQSGRGAAITY